MGSGQVRPQDGLEEYLSIRRSRYAATTLRNEGFVLRRFVSHVGNIQVRHLRPEHVADWFYGRNGFCGPHTTRDRVHREPVTASTHNFYRTRLASFFRFCTTRGWTRQDLLRDVEPMRLPTVKRLQPAPADLLAMLEATGNGRDRAYIATAINSGLRANEMLRIRVGDVDLPAATTAVTISKSAEEDSFPITSDLDPELRRWLVVYQDDLDRPFIRMTTCFRLGVPACTSGTTPRTAARCAPAPLRSGSPRVLWATPRGSYSRPSPHSASPPSTRVRTRFAVRPRATSSTPCRATWATTPRCGQSPRCCTTSRRQRPSNTSGCLVSASAGTTVFRTAVPERPR